MHYKAYFAADLTMTKGVERLLMMTLTNFCGNLADRGTNAQMLLKWKMTGFEDISNA